jgi:PAS domain S-box-containing protein
MSSSGKPRTTKGDLRRLAEDRLKGETPPARDRKPDTHAVRLVHELEVHQIELQMQNEELLRARQDVEGLLARYTDLYDLAPTAYVTLDSGGSISQANIEATRLLGVERAALKGRQLRQFLAEADRRDFGDFLKTVFVGCGRGRCDVTLARPGQGPLYVRIEGLAFEDGHTCRAALLDLTQERQAREQQVRLAQLEAQKLVSSERGRRALLSTAEDARAAAAALAESEQRLRSLYSSMSEGLVLHELVYSDGKPKDYRIIEVNPAFETITGLTRAQVTGALASVVYGTGIAPFLDVYAKVAETGIPTSFETEWSPMAKAFHISVFSPARGRFATVFTDVTERKRAEEALRRSEERFRAVASNTPDHILMQDADLRYEFVLNPQLGLTERDMLGKTDYDFLSRVEADQLTTMKRQVMESGRALRVEVPLTSREGGLEFFEGSYVPRRDDRGRVNGLIGYFRNVTERRRTQTRLSEQALMLASVNDAIVGYDADYRVTFWNRSAELMYGYSEAEASGRVSTDLFQPVYVHGTREQMAERLAADGHIEVESLRKTRDGRHISVEAHVIALRDEQGAIAGYVSVDRDITERKRADEALRKSNSFNQSIIDSSSDCIKILDMNGRLTFMSPAGQRLLGIKDMAAYLNLPYEQFWEGSDREAAAAAIREARQGQGGSFQGYCPTADGVPKWWDVSISPVPGTEGKPESLLVVSRDVTERRRSDEALREAKETLEVRVRERTAELTTEIEERKLAEQRLAAASQYSRSLLEASLDPMVTINSEGRITDVNEATIKATGATRVELIGTDFSEYFTEPEKAREGYKQVFSRGYATDYPLTIRRGDGRLTDVFYNASLYRDADGAVRGVFAAARDVTARKRAEALAEAERQRLRDVLNMLPAYVILLAPDYTVPFANRFFEERFGKSMGRRCYDYLFHRMEPCENCETYTVMKTKGPHHWEWLGPDGRNYDIYDFPFRDADGSPLIMEVGIDITERVQAEQALQKAHDTLEVKVDERTADLKRSNEELEQFAYVASHDLQQPLRMVASYVELLRKRYAEKLDPNADKYINYAVGGAKRMQALINDLLMYSRAGTRAISFSPVDLETVLEKAEANLAVAIRQATATIEHNRLPIVSGEEVQLVQLFQNLLDNALKFRGGDPPVIRITAEGIEDSRIQGLKPERNEQPLDSSNPRPLESFWRISVSDNGIGIDPQHSERIFKIFQRLHTEEEYPGTGIGLAVCRRIVERHGGRIWVEPGQTKGTKFAFTLPRRNSPDAPGAMTREEQFKDER